MEALAQTEAEVREYKSQHDSVQDLPLVTGSATVTEVRTMDEDRRGEVWEAVQRELEESDVDLSSNLGSAPRADGDYAAVRDALADAPADMARRLETLVERAERPKPMLVSARIKPHESFDFVAGQYAGMRYIDTSRAYSIASSPNEDEIELCVRRVPDGRLSPRVCDDMEPGDEITLRGPHGELVLEEPSSRDSVFLATGTGVAPFKGMIDYAFEEGLDTHEGEERDIWLVLGAAWEDDLPYHEEFEALADENENFHYVPTLSREPYLSEWGGETDYVQHTFLKHVDTSSVRGALDKRVEDWLKKEPISDTTERIDPTEVDVYACGINAMVFSLVNAAEGVGVPPERIESEGFG